MIKSIHLRNFQSHKNTKLTFDKGMNAIIGESQAGKSSILKAIDFVRCNKPSKENIFHHGADRLFVQIEFTDGNKIKLAKTISKNSTIKSIYTINGVEYKAFGKTPPVEVDELFMMSDINIQRQLDNAFLITETPGEIARQINKVTNLDIATEWIKTLTSKVNEKNAAIKVITSDIENIENNISQYDGVERIGELFDQFHIINDKIRHIKKKKSLIQSYLHLSESIKKINKIKDSLDRLFIEINDINNQLSFLHEKKRLCMTFKKQKVTISKLNNYSENITKQVEDLQNINMEISKRKDKHKLLHMFIEQQKSISYYTNQITKLQNDYNKTLRKAGKCPICFRSTKDI